MNHFASITFAALCALLLACSTEAYGRHRALDVLEDNCFECHSHTSGKSKGGLLLDSREALVSGGDHGSVLVPGYPDKSLLVKAVSYMDPKLQMPPKVGKLSESDIAALIDWIKLGAPWERNQPADKSLGAKLRVGKEITDRDREWWAFQPRRSPPVPKIRSSKFSLQNDVDRFIAARLESENIVPSPEATRAVLIRRVTFDLTGLPPTPAEVDAFVQNPAPSTQSYEALVDRLLASPAYGERMARYWLDLVRYADGDGYRADDYRPDAWRFRDYVIRSFNADKPYTRFIQEQLAGDELFPDDPDAIIATGYLRHGIYEWNARDVHGQWDTILNDITDTTGDVFFGLGIQCARCHDHKFDPILQRDYYRLRAFFSAIQPGDRIAATSSDIMAHELAMKQWNERTALIRAELKQIEQPYLESAEKSAVAKFPDDIQGMIRKPAAERTPHEAQLAELAWRQVTYEWDRIDRAIKGEDKDRYFALRRQLALLEQGKPKALPVALAATDVGPIAPALFIPKKKALGEIEPGILTLLDPNPSKITPMLNSTGRRATLARWLSLPENPFTARVMVNRIWQQHFGRGIAANSSDFGTLGERPTHPELLDWLADRFVRDGWSLKKLHRLLVTSAAYRRSSEHPHPESGRLIDPENRLLWQWKPRRLEAEQLRDSMLAISGQLKLISDGPGVPPDVPQRTIFTRFMRNSRDPLADVFDAPLWFTSAASRDTTTTPVQSLHLVNSVSMRKHGRAFAERLEKLRPNDIAGQVREAYRLAYGREASRHEVKSAQTFIATQSRLADQSRLSSGQAGFIPGKIPYRDGQGAFFEPGSDQTILRTRNLAKLELEKAFTIEAFILPRSIADSSDLRTIVAKWDSNTNTAGWTLGITGQKSRRKPFTVALQLVGTRRDGQRVEHPVFSDLPVQLNKPYFVAASVTPASEKTVGSVLFAVKDLSNDDEPLLTAVINHEITSDWINEVPLTVGARSGTSPQSFHGLIDDVRLSNAQLPVSKLLYTSEFASEATIGFWRFETRPDVFADSSGRGLVLERYSTTQVQVQTPAQAALGDFCLALFNSSEFLYTE